MLVGLEFNYMYMHLFDDENHEMLMSEVQSNPLILGNKVVYSAE